MTIQELETSIRFLDQDNITVELFFLFKDNDEVCVKKALLGIDLQLPIVREIVRPFISRELSSAEDIIQYDPSITPDRKSLFEIDSSEIEQYRLAMMEADEIEAFNHDDWYENIRGYMIKISQWQNEITAIRKSFSTHTMKKWFSIRNRNGQFTKFDNKVFTLDERIDAFLVNNKFIIFQRTNFEQTFMYNIQLEVQARRNAQELIDRYNILEVTSEHLNEYLDRHCISKLRKIDMSLIEDGTMSYVNLNGFCNYFNIDIGKDDDNQKFKPENKKQFKTFIKILSDDYLESRLTSRKYAANSKERFGA